MDTKYIVMAALTLLTCDLISADSATGIDVGLCPPKIIQCPCGEQRTLFHTTIKQCTFFKGNEWNCKACSDETEKQICSKFRHCHACDSDHNWRCELCPMGRGGIWCDEELTGCEPIQTTENVITEPSLDNLDVIPRGTEIRFTCANGYSLIAGSASRTCRDDDTWSGVDPICIRKSITNQCPPIPTPDHSSHEILDKGKRIKYSCHNGFTLRGSEFIQCINNNWSPQPPHCEQKIDAKMCPQVDPVYEGSVSVILKGVLPSTFVRSEVEPASSLLGPFQDGTQLLYTCSSKFFKLFGSTSRTCTDGQWSGSAPTCVPVCGRSSNPATPFVTNSMPSRIGQWPWMVAIRLRTPENQWSFHCGGSIISDRWILTAAHCVTVWKTNIKLPLDSLRLYLGKHFEVDFKDDEEVQIRQPKVVHVHPDYDVTSMDSDIALISVSPSIRLSSRVQPVCLPDPDISDSNLQPGNMGSVTGWGHNENATVAQVLSYAQLPVVSLDKCRAEYRKHEIKVTDNMICAGYDEGVQDVCSGDSGGPFVFPKDLNKQWWVIEGIISWGGPGKCGDPFQYSGFVRVANFVEWIRLFLYQ